MSEILVRGRLVAASVPDRPSCFVQKPASISIARTGNAGEHDTVTEIKVSTPQARALAGSLGMPIEIRIRVVEEHDVGSAGE